VQPPRGVRVEATGRRQRLARGCERGAVAVADQQPDLRFLVRHDLAGRRDHGFVDAVSLGRREPYAGAPERVFVRGAPLLLAYEPGHAGNDE
jgi:hypothetical protein